jgi:uncharacterized membrane protein YvbJ
MALTHCPECQHEVSTQATACPNCGYPFQPLQQTQHVPDKKIAYLVEQEEQRQERRKNGQIAAGISLIMLILFIIIFAVGHAAIQTSQYQICTTGTLGVGNSYSSSLMPAGTPCP